MLLDVLEGKENSQIILLKDHIKSDGLQLLKCFLTSLSHRVEKIHLFLLETLPHVLKDLPDHTVNRLSVHNMTKDPLGWDGNTTITMETNIPEYITTYMSTRRHRKVAMVFDSLTNMILHRGPAYTCQVLQRCTRITECGIEVCPVVAVVHSELHDNVTLNMLNHTATTIMAVHPAITEGYHGNCNILHKKLSGKVLRSREQYKTGVGCTIENTEDVRDVPVVAQVGGGGDQIDPAANLTFNLNLSEQEKEARSKVVLPYLRKPEKSEVSVSSGSGKIFYQPDDADDFDEEDPDDDLDI